MKLITNRQYIEDMPIDDIIRRLSSILDISLYDRLILEISRTDQGIDELIDLINEQQDQVVASRKFGQINLLIKEGREKK